MITIPSLSSVDDILDTDVVMVTHSNGQTFKIPGVELNKRNQAVISENTTLTGAPLKTRNIIRAYFTADLVAANSSTPLTLSYNSVSYTVKVPKNGALANYLPFDVGGGVYKYLQAYTTLELLFDGTNLVVQGNPVVLSSADYTIYPDGNSDILIDVPTGHSNFTIKYHIVNNNKYLIFHLSAFEVTQFGDSFNLLFLPAFCRPSTTVRGLVILDDYSIGSFVQRHLVDIDIMAAGNVQCWCVDAIPAQSIVSGFLHGDFIVKLI